LLDYILILKLEALCPSRTLVNFYRITWYHLWEDSNNNCCENLRSNIGMNSDWRMPVALCNDTRTSHLLSEFVVHWLVLYSGQHSHFRSSINVSTLSLLTINPSITFCIWEYVHLRTAIIGNKLECPIYWQPFHSIHYWTISGSIKSAFCMKYSNQFCRHWS
jgi:hypothetical protein